MGVLTRNIYRAYTAADLYNRASATADKTQQSTSVDFANLTSMKVRNVLGASANTWSHLCNHANINKWSGFSPLILSINNPGMDGEIVWSNPAGNPIGSDFAGYNHGAIVPAYYSTTHDDTVTTVSDAESIQVEVQFDLGELILTDIGAMGIALAVFNGASYVTHAARALSTLKDQCRASNSRAFTVYVNGPSGNSSWDNPQYITYSFRLYLISGTDYSYNTNEMAKLFHVQLPQFTKIIRKRFPTVAHSSMPAGYTMPYLDYSYTTGLLSLIAAKDTGSANVNIVVTTYDESNTQLNAEVIYTGVMDTNGVTISNRNIGTNPAYDRHIQVSINPY